MFKSTAAPRQREQTPEEEALRMVWGLWSPWGGRVDLEGAIAAGQKRVEHFKIANDSLLCAIQSLLYAQRPQSQRTDKHCATFWALEKEEVFVQFAQKQRTIEAGQPSLIKVFFLGVLADYLGLREQAKTLYEQVVNSLLIRGPFQRHPCHRLGWFCENPIPSQSRSEADALHYYELAIVKALGVLPDLQVDPIAVAGLSQMELRNQQRLQVSDGENNGFTVVYRNSVRYFLECCGTSSRFTQVIQTQYLEPEILWRYVQLRAKTLISQPKGVEKQAGQKAVIRCYDVLSALPQPWPDAVFELGRCYLEGKHVTADPAKGRLYLQRAAELGVPQALFEVGQWYLRGEGLDLDIRKGSDYLQLAARLGVPDALSIVGQWHLSGVGADLNPSQGVAYLLRAADKDCSAAQYELSLYLRGFKSGAGLAPDTDEGLRLLQVAARQEFKPAQFELAQLRMTGVQEKLVKDVDTGFQELDALAQQGFALAQFVSGMLYWSGQNGVRKNPGKAQTRIAAAAKQGDSKAQLWLKLHPQNSGKVSLEEAFIGLQVEAATGSPEAQSLLKQFFASAACASTAALAIEGVATAPAAVAERVPAQSAPHLPPGKNSCATAAEVVSPVPVAQSVREKEPVPEPSAQNTSGERIRRELTPEYLMRKGPMWPEILRQRTKTGSVPLLPKSEPVKMATPSMF